MLRRAKANWRLSDLTIYFVTSFKPEADNKAGADWPKALKNEEYKCDAQIKITPIDKWWWAMSLIWIEPVEELIPPIKVIRAEPAPLDDPNIWLGPSGQLAKFASDPYEISLIKRWLVNGLSYIVRPLEAGIETWTRWHDHKAEKDPISADKWKFNLIPVDSKYVEKYLIGILTKDVKPAWVDWSVKPDNTGRLVTLQ